MLRNVGKDEPNGATHLLFPHWHAEYPKVAVSDPTGPREGFIRVFRGGGWRFEAAVCWSAVRCGMVPSGQASINGLRVALSPSGIPQ